MSGATRRADVVWNGNLFQGGGEFSVGSGAFPSQGVTWASRTEESGGNTSPEELVAAAHASCYAMALSNTMDEAGHPPERLEISSVVTFAPKPGGGMMVAKSALTVCATVSGLDATGFDQLARKGEEGCPVSNALRGNVEITVDSSLAT